MFKILSIDMSGIAEANSMLSAYADAVSDPTIIAKDTDSLQRVLESYIGRKIGGQIVNGKVGQRQSADFLLPGSSSLVKALYADAKSTEQKSVEFKGSTKQAVTIGQITIGGKQEFIYTPGVLEPFTATSVKQKILGKRLGSASGYLVDLDPNLSSAGDKSKYIFDNYLGKDARLKQIFYEKASTMLLANTYHLNDSTGTRLIGIKIPKRYFTNTFFTATIVGKAIVISIRENFKNNFVREINESYLQEQKAKKGYKKSFTIGGKSYKIDYLPIMSGETLLGIGNTAGTITTKVPKVEQATRESTQAPQKIITNAQWSVLVQRRLGKTMASFGEAAPPELTERTGRFRRSIQVSVNYKIKLIQYTFNPLYRSLEHYGYHPELQVERSIREVAQELYSTHFNILRRGTIA